MTPEQAAAVCRYEAGESVFVTEFPNYHAHPECGGLAHGHGDCRFDPEPHTHRRVEAWGDAVPLLLPAGSTGGRDG